VPEVFAKLLGGKGAMTLHHPVSPLPKALPRRTPAQGEKRATVAILSGCVMNVLYHQVNLATIRVLAANGCEVISPPGQKCCGALHAHNGYLDEARDKARQTIEVFERAGVGAIVVNSAGCGSTMKEYGHLLEGDPKWAARAAAMAAKVRDVSEFLDDLGLVQPLNAVRETVAYHDACHLAHAQGVRAQPRQLLRDVPGLELREIAEGELCCGSAGIYNILNPGPARELGDRKAANIVATGADLLVTANPGCLMQVASAIERSGHPMGMAHTVELLDASIRGMSVDDLTTTRNTR
jgi:glycolate oxidase iron-sulfur subunit